MSTGTKFAAALVGAALVAGLAWWAADGAAPDAGTAARGDAAGVAGPRAAEHEAEPGVPEPEPGDAVSAPANARAEARAGEGAQSPSIEVQLRTDTGLPAEFAQLAVADEAFEARGDVQAYLELGVTAAEVARAYAPGQRADGLGVARVRRPATTATLYARLGALEARGTLEPDREEPLVLTLLPRLELELETVDAGGLPNPGVPLRVVAREPSGRSHVVVERLETDEQGLAEVVVTRRGDGGVALVEVHPIALIDDPAPAVVDPRVPPLERVRLRVPRLVDVHVHVLEPDGSPVPRAAVALRLAGDGVDADAPPWPVETGTTGAAIARDVQAGALVAVEATHPREARTGRFEGRTPQLVEQARLDVELAGFDGPVAELLVVQRDGELLADAPLVVRTRQGPFLRWQEVAVRTDAAGVARVELVEVEIWIDDGDPPWQVHVLPVEQPALHGSAEVPAAGTGAPQRVDLVRRPLVASGRVLDETGRAVVGATVVANAKGLHGVPEARTGASGWFELYGAYLDREPVRLAASAPDCTERGAIEVALGTERTTISLPRGLTIRGSLQLDPSVRARWSEVGDRFRVAEFPPPGRVGGSPPRFSNAGPTFLWRGAPTDLAGVCLYVDDAHGGGLPVASAGLRPDPEHPGAFVVEPFDATAWRATRVALKDWQGRLVPDGQLWFGGDEPPDPFELAAPAATGGRDAPENPFTALAVAVRGEGAHNRVLHTGGIVNVLLRSNTAAYAWSPRHEALPVRISLGLEHQEFTLDALPTMRLSWPGALDLPTDGPPVQAYLRQVRDRDARQHLVAFGADGEAVVTLPDDGPWTVEPTRAGKLPPRGPDAPTQPFRRRFEARAVDREQPLPLPWNAAAVQQALAQPAPEGSEPE